MMSVLPVAVVASAVLLLADAPSILQQRCVACHANVRTLSQNQRLLEMIGGEKPRMPKAGPPLSAKEIAEIRQWVADGAKWPEETWWSLRPIPAAAPGASIDTLIAAKLREQKLTPSPQADRRTLIRRLTYDLHGLPPSWDEVRAFIADGDTRAYEKLVDRLLASPRYGERWGRHWLDVAHYGESHGYDKDKPRRNAWPYRDYVIRSLNEDLPYPRFVEQQLAGDVLYPGDPQGIIATGFIAAGPWDFVGHKELREGTVDKQITRVLDRDDMVMATMSAFTSMTAHCARCHNHKFDPIPQEDYYSLQAVFAGIDRADRAYDISLGGPMLVYAATPLPEPRAVNVLLRGSVENPGKTAVPGALSCLQGLRARFAEAGDEGQRRAALAHWITDRGNVLAWRSIVNRVWHYHFGAGIVDSLNDFGHMGSQPTNPALLDWLAATFRDVDGGSLKKLHKRIVMSAAYRQSSGDNAANQAIDGDNRFLWRMNRTRLDAESVRDTALYASGKLDLTMGGPAAEQFWFKDDHSPIYDYARFDVDSAASYRRSVYRFIVRSVPDPFMDRLDCPDASLVTAKRNVTITAIQALALLNNPFMVRQAEHLAERVRALTADPEAQVRELFRLTLQRDPQAAEWREVSAYAARYGLENACRVMLNSNEFLFVD